MTAREWQPGDVAMMTAPDGREFMAVRTKGGEDHWSAPRGWPVGVSDYMCEARPLVVLDLAAAPLSDEAEATAAQLLRWTGSRTAEWIADQIEAQAKPTQPTGLGAVVVDARGSRWTLTCDPELSDAKPWCRDHLPSCGVVFAEWSDIDAVRVLSEGVTA